MIREIRQRVYRPATPEEKARHDRVRRQIDEEMPDRSQWAAPSAKELEERVSIVTVFTAEEARMVEAIDEYAATHGLKTRDDVVRKALALLLDVVAAGRS